MPPSKVIRIDEQVWAELQKRARPLEDTPNSVLRRVFGLAEEDSDERILGLGLADEKSHTDLMDSRVASLLNLVRSKSGEMPQVRKSGKQYSFWSRTGTVAAYIRPQKERLRIGAKKETAQNAGLSNWDRERKDGTYVRWYIPDEDPAAYGQAADLLHKLWSLDSQP